MPYSKELIESLKEHEGFSPKVYTDSLGFLTIGYGQLVSELSVSKDTAAEWMLDALGRKVRELETYLCFREVKDPVRRDVLIEMAYNLGVAGLMKFRKMWAAIEHKDWDTAAKEMTNSRWAEQVRGRANTLAVRMRTGRY